MNKRKKEDDLEMIADVAARTYVENNLIPEAGGERATAEAAYSDGFQDGYKAAMKLQSSKK